MKSKKHCFNIEVAKDVGINAALVFENLSFWVNHNAATGRNLRDGVYWTYGTHKDIAEQFDYLTVKQVRTALDKLIGHGYIRTGRYNKHKYDRTGWYTLTDKALALTDDGQPEKPAGKPRKATEGETIPDIKAKISKTDIDPHLAQRAHELAIRCGVSV